MGLCNLKVIDELISGRKRVTDKYNSILNKDKTAQPKIGTGVTYNHAYYPVIFRSEKEALLVRKNLQEMGVSTRRYFYPSLNNLPYVKDGEACPVSEDISSRVLCLPMYHDLEDSWIEKIATEINNTIK
jgi:dTDP-4-amino-4,6-dideoxygalactose transaminase